MATNKVDQYLSLAINSILNQTYRDFDFIIIANGPKCNEVENFINENFQDCRITIIKSQIPQLAHALNLGIDVCQSDFIARMDADDISHKSRIERQLSFIIDNDIDILGCDINLINSNGKFLKTRRYPKGKDIKKYIFFKNPFAHNTVIYKRESILKLRGYNSGFNTEDYDLWLRADRNNLKMENMNDILLDYRIHSESTQGNSLGYAEACGYMLREFLIRKSASSFISIPINILKYYLKSK